MSAIEKALLKGRGRDEGLKYKLRKIRRVTTKHAEMEQFRRQVASVEEEIKDRYKARTVDWLGRRANFNRKIKWRAMRFLIKERLKNGKPDVVVAPEFFPTAENISKIRKIKNDNKK